MRRPTIATFGRAVGVLFVVSFLCAIQAVRVAASPNDIGGMIQTAQHDFDLGNYLSAIRILQSAVPQNSSSAEAYYWLARSYYELRDFDNAISQAEKAVALDVKNSLYHQWLGRAYGGKADRGTGVFCQEG